MYQSIPSLTIPRGDLRGFARSHYPGSRVFAQLPLPGGRGFELEKFSTVFKEKCKNFSICFRSHVLCFFAGLLKIIAPGVGLYRHFSAPGFGFSHFFCAREGVGNSPFQKISRGMVKLGIGISEDECQKHLLLFSLSIFVKIRFSSVHLFHIFLKNIQNNQLLQSTKALDTKYNKELLITIITHFERDKIRSQL